MKANMQERHEKRHERMMAENVCSAVRFLLSPDTIQFLERNQESLQKILVALASHISAKPSSLNRRYYPDILEDD